jgi:hypothetical protein
VKLRRAQYVSLVVTAIGVVFQWVAILGLRHGGARLAFAIGGEVLVGVCLVGSLAVLYIDSMNKSASTWPELGAECSGPGLVTR